MEYMEQQMQNYIEAGIMDADRCYARIAELERQLSSTKNLLESSMLSEATAKQYAEEVDKQNAALAAQVEVLKQSIISVRARGNLLHNITMQILQGAELNGSDWDYISESQVAEIEQHLTEIRVQAGRDAADSLLRLADNFQTSSKEFENGVRMAAEYLKTQNAGSIRHGKVM